MVGLLGIAGRAAVIAVLGAYGQCSHCVHYCALGNPLLNVPVLSLYLFFWIVS